MYKFRASAAHNLLNSGRGKDEVFGKTAQKWFVELYVEKTYGRKKIEKSNKFFEKGNESEEDSITLLSSVDRKFYVKNNDYFQNEFFTGTPDIVTADEIIDIKTPFDIFTFFDHKAEPLPIEYEVQLLVYMALAGKSKARLAYCLVNTPDEIMIRETKYFDAEKLERYSNLYDYSDIAENERVYTVEYNFNEELYSKLVERAKLAREWIEKNLEQR